MTITVVIPVSPVRSHPDISILTETIDSVRFWLPDSELIVTFDGVREEQEHLRNQYEEATRRTLWRLDHHYGNAAPFVFERHTHQVGMLRRVLDEVRTDLLLYVESDTPITTDEPIDWKAIIDFIQSGEANLVRFAHESHVLPVHAHMFHGLVGSFVRTSQWSQRPHVASKAYYRRILDAHFSPDACSFLEDRLHGVCDDAFRIDGMNGFNQHRLFLYHPSGGNIKRSYHLDARDGEPKYDASQRF